MNTWKDKIPEDWSVKKFSDIAELRHGYQFRDYDFTKSGIKVCKITQIKGEGITDISNCSFIDESRLDKFNKFIIKKGDILIALTGATIGKIGRFNEDEIVLQNYRVGNFFPIDDNNLSKEYLYQFLRSNYFYNQILTGQTQSAQQNIGKDDINNMSVILPPLPEQQAIAEILSSLDDKIELNLQTNKTLEEMANTLYKHWFVDFGPFKTGKFIESELGMIPEGWEVVNIGDYVETLGGGTPSTTNEEYWVNGDINWYSPTDLTKQKSLFSCYTEKKITSLGLSKSSARLFPVYSLLMSSRATIGLITINTKEACTNQGFITLLPNKTFSLYQLHSWLLQNMELIISKANGSTFKEISKSNFRELKILKAKNIESYITNAKEIFNLIENNIEENNSLKKIRDYLLPKLISGEIQVKQAAKLAKQVL